MMCFHKWKVLSNATKWNRFSRWISGRFPDGSVKKTHEIGESESILFIIIIVSGVFSFLFPLVNVTICSIAPEEGVITGVASLVIGMPSLLAAITLFMMIWTSGREGGYSVKHDKLCLKCGKVKLGATNVTIAQIKAAKKLASKKEKEKKNKNFWACQESLLIENYHKAKVEALEKAVVS